MIHPKALLSVLGSLLLVLASSAGAQPTLPAQRIQTLSTSTWSPASPDPSGICFRAETGDFWTTDNEVDEMAIFQGKQLWRHDGAGVVSESFGLLGFTNEPAGITFDPAGGRAWFADDNKKTIWEVDFGADGVFLTADDVTSDMDGLVATGCTDPEDVTYNPFTGNLHVSSIDNSWALCTISPGPNGEFEGAGSDDVVTITPLLPLGGFPLPINKPKGIVYDPLENTLIVADRNNRDLFEFSLDGSLLRKIDTSVPTGRYRPSGVTIAPSSVNPMLRSLYVTDNGFDNIDDPNENDGRIHEFVVAPLNGNAGPNVDAGPAQSIEWPVDQVSLDGAVTDDGHPYPPSALTYEWVLQSGPGAVTFGDADEPDTTATFSDPGVYVLRLEADDFALGASDTVEITVVPPMYELGVSIVGAGDVSVDPPTGPYAEGTLVTLTATPEPGSTFSGWSGDLSGANNPGSLEMTADRAVQAEFHASQGGGAGCGIGPELALLVPALFALRRRVRGALPA